MERIWISVFLSEGWGSDSKKICVNAVNGINLIYCFAGVISSPKRGTQCANLTKSFIVRTVEGRSRSVIRSCGCDQEERRLSLETGIEEVCFEVFPEGCNRGAISYLEGKGVPKNRGIVTERIGKVFD